MFSNPRDSALGYLVLRHLHDGDIIDYPLPDDSPHVPLFQALEARGYIARWHRIWPLSDRYRLTELGVQTIESAYQPSGADEIFQQLRAQNLSPDGRRRLLQQRGLDPVLWPVLHDPYTHWLTWSDGPGPYHRYIWEDVGAATRARRREREREEEPGGIDEPYGSFEPFGGDGAAGSELVDLDARAGLSEAAGDPGYTRDLS